MARPGRFGLQVKLVVWVGRYYQRDAASDLYAVRGQVFDLAWVVGHQAYRLHFKGVQHMSGCAVLALVVAEAEGKVGINRVITVVLQSVCAYLVGEADSAPLLPHV